MEKAIDKLTDYNFLGRPIFVREDREKPSINREKLYSIFVGNVSNRIHKFSLVTSSINSYLTEQIGGT